jgi:MFS transporter, ACS family, glucarate transporter
MTLSKIRWNIVILLSATATTSYMCRVNVSTAGVMLMDEFNLSQVEMGRIFSAFLFGYALCQIPGGILVDRYGPHRVLPWAALCWVLLTGAQTLVGPIHSGFLMISSLSVFLIIRFCLGVTESPTFTGAAKGIQWWIPRPNQGSANGMVLAAVGIGSAVTPPLVSFFMIHWGWRIGLLVSAIPALVMVAFWYFIRDKFSSQDGKINAQPLTDSNPTSLFSRHFLLLTFSYTLQGYVGYIFVSWFYLYLIQERHFGLLAGAWMSSVPWILSLVSIPLGGFISDRLPASRLGPVWGRRFVPMAGMIFSGMLISIGAYTLNPILAAICLAFATALVLCVEGPFWATLLRVSGSRSGSAGGVMNTGSNLGGLISPWLTPLIASHIGWANALHVAGLASIAAGLLWLGVIPSTTAESVSGSAP